MSKYDDVVSCGTPAAAWCGTGELIVAEKLHAQDARNLTKSVDLLGVVVVTLGL